jgi:serine/threonine-protein kinase
VAQAADHEPTIAPNRVAAAIGIPIRFRAVSRACPQCRTVYADAVFFCGQDGTITVEVQNPADPDARLGTRLGGYLVVARVADGAMGRVYEGRHPESKARVAIKVLHPDVARDGVAVERFKREYETAREFDHRYIVTVLEFGETGDGSFFLTMEYLEGEELGELLRRDGAIPRERVVRILSQLSLGLDYAHSFGVIHRDLKPDNVFLCRSPEGDEVRILDFGSVKLQMEMGPKLTAFGTTLGSPYYMSPEQAMGKQDVDQRTDIFAVAAILFEMCTGKIAFEGSTVAEILMKIVNGTPPMASQTRPGVPAGLDDVIQRGLQKDKNQRFDSCAQLAESALMAYGVTSAIDAVATTPQDALAASLASVAAPQVPPGQTPLDLPADLGRPPALVDNRPLGSLPPQQSMRPPMNDNTLLIGVGVAVVGMLFLGAFVVALLFWL